MYFKFFDLGNGLWVKLFLTVKLGERFITGIKHWIQKNSKPMPLLLNTVVTNSSDARVASIDGSPSRLFLKDGEIKGFSSPSKEILMIFKRNGHYRIFHGRWDKEECEDGRTLFKFKAWEEKPATEEKKPFSPIMADAIEEALEQDSRQGKKGSNDRRYQRREEKSRFFKQARREKPKKKSVREYLAEVET